MPLLGGRSRYFKAGRAVDWLPEMPPRRRAVDLCRYGLYGRLLLRCPNAFLR